VVWGEITNSKNNDLADLVARERLMLAPLLILIVWMGMYSNHFLRPMDASVTRIVNQLQNRNAQFADAPEIRNQNSEIRIPK
jgi:NADH-quinone oxidoreductase subunit M